MMHVPSDQNALYWNYYEPGRVHVARSRSSISNEPWYVTYFMISDHMARAFETFTEAINYADEVSRGVGTR